jgi:hypothetical protein
MLGQKTLNTSKTSSSLLKSIENDVHKGINNVIADLAKELNIHDFYSAHILDYCEVCCKLKLFKDLRLMFP